MKDEFKGETIKKLMQLTDDVIETEHDGEGIPYYNQPDGVADRSDEDGEDEMERSRR